MTRRLGSGFCALMLASMCNCTSSDRDADPIVTEARTSLRQLRASGSNPRPEETDSPEVPLDPPLSALVSPPYEETSPAIVATGTGGALIAWFDGRTNGITATLVDGTTLQPLASTQTGIALVDRTTSTSTLNGAEPPALATNGAGTAVLAWTEEHLDKTTYAYAERFNPATGMVVPADAGGVQLGPTGNHHNPVVAWDGANFVVAWAGVSASTAQMATPILTVRIDPTRGVNAADGQGALLTTASGPLTGPVLVGCAPAACFFAWNDSAVETYFYPRGGPVTSGSPSTAPIFGSAVGVASDGSRFLLGVEVGAQVRSIAGQIELVYELGAGVYSLGGAYQSSIAPVGRANTSLAGFVYDGSDFVSTADDAFLYVNGATVGSSSSFTAKASSAMALVNGSLVVADAVALRNGFFGGSPTAIEAASFNPSNFASVTSWQLESIGAVSERGEFIVASAESGAIEPTIYSWRATPTSDSTLYATRVDPASGAANPSDADGLVVAINLTNDMTTPVVPPAGGATDGAHQFVAFGGSASRGFDTGVFNPATATLGASSLTDIPGGDALKTIRIAYGAGTYMVATDDGTRVVASAFNSTTFAASVGPVHVVDGSATMSAFSNRSGASVAFDGSRFLFVWSDNRSGVATIYGAHVASNAAVAEANGFVVSNGVFSETAPSMAVHQNGALVVWSDTRDEDSVGNIYGRLLDATGTPLGSDFAIAVAVGDQSSPVVVDAGDGVNYQVAWTDTRTDPRGDIYGTLVGFDGTVRQPNGDALANSSDAETTPSLATTSAGSLLLSYVRHDTSIGLGTDRIRARVLATGSTAGKCTSDNDCATLHCTDGLCCNVACNESCQTCNGASPGICTSVLSANDPDTCSGDVSCNSKGTCSKILGQACSAASECVSGFCADGVCCNSACSGGCDSCDVSARSAGTCTILPAGSSGANPSCLPETCNGTSASCPSSCTSDSDCVRPYTCGADHTCEVLAGASCKDAHTIEATDGTLKDCTPYACEVSNCVNSCHSVEDCAPGSICDADGTCAAPTSPTLAGGCALTPGGESTNLDPAAFGAIFAVLACFEKRRRRQL